MPLPPCSKPQNPTCTALAAVPDKNLMQSLSALKESDIGVLVVDVARLMQEGRSKVREGQGTSEICRALFQETSRLFFVRLIQYNFQLD